MRRFIIWLVIAFCVFFVFTQPRAAGDLVGKALGGVGHGFSSVIIFLGSVLPKQHHT